MIDSQLLGETAAKCMEYLDEHEGLDGGEIHAVLIIVVAENADRDTTFTRTFCSKTMYYEQLGLAGAGLECVKDGFRSGPVDPKPDADDDDE
jgi:hypothetical protein